MRSQALIVTGAAILLGLLAVVAVNLFLGRSDTTKQTASTSTTTLVVAATPLYFGAKIGPEQLKTVEWPADAVPPGSFRTLAEVTGDASNPRVALRPIEVNEPILASKVSGKGGRLSMSGMIGDNMRAATVRVNDVVGVGGFILPGDRVDVFITRDRPDNDDEKMTDLLMQNVRVVGVDTDANEAKDQPEVVKTATLEVTAEQAMKLTLAQEVGQISLALRNLTNDQPEVARTLLERDLRDGLTAAPAAAPAPVRRATYQGPRRAAAPSGNAVEVVRGTTQQNYRVPAYGGT